MENKFRDIVDILPQPGRHRDMAQHSGTVPAIPGWLVTMSIILDLANPSRHEN